MVNTITKPTADTTFRLSWPAILAALVAILSLWARENTLFSPLPLMCAALLISRSTSFRMESSSQYWMVRVPLFILVVLLGISRPFTDTSGLYDPRIVCLIGELLACELTIQAWRAGPAGGGQGVVTILLSGLILLAAADSTEDRTIWISAPAYVFCLALALPGFRSPQTVHIKSIYKRSAMAWAALTMALLIGAGFHFAFRTFRDGLTDWGMRMLREIPAPPNGSGALSTSPMLGSSFGLEGSDTQTYKIEGSTSAQLPQHFRVMSFDMYAFRGWLPTENSRTFHTELPHPLPKSSRSVWKVTRLSANGGLLAMPLETAVFDLMDQHDTQWSKELGPLKSDTETPSSYQFTVGAAFSEGPFSIPPDLQQKSRLLSIPRELNPEVKKLAMQAVRGAKTPAEKAAAIEAYLPAHHAYSLSYKPGHGDPISRFLLSSSAAHCEYFASAAVMLMRCAGIPARYVIGYYAHEQDANGAIIIRQRDAHAWAEAWIEGKGWTTIDATPGDGRPDKTPGIGLFTRIKEWFADNIMKIRSKLGRIGIVVVLIALGSVGMWIAWRNLPGRNREIRKKIQYESPDDELKDLAAKFEKICIRNGCSITQNRTWADTIESLPNDAVGVKTRLNIEIARKFIALYSNARWSGFAGNEISQLHDLLEKLKVK